MIKHCSYYCIDLFFSQVSVVGMMRLLGQSQTTSYSYPTLYFLTLGIIWIPWRAQMVMLGARLTA